MIELPYGKKDYDNTLRCFHTIPERNGRTDRQIAISISRVSILTHDRNREIYATGRTGPPPQVSYIFPPLEKLSPVKFIYFGCGTYS